LSREFERTKARYAQAKDDARRQAALNVRAQFGCDFNLGGWSRRTMEAYSATWREMSEHRLAAGGGWDWPDIFSRYRSDFHALDLAMWSSNDHLCGLALMCTTGPAVKLEAVEEYPVEGCSLKRLRAVIAVETAVCYAQALGKSEVRLALLWH
jgi:hypothetical protein